MEAPMIQGKRVLLVDDERRNRGAVRLLLEIDEHRVTEADNGALALDLFAPAKFDLVITNQHLPQMTGAELAARIKRLSPTQPVIMAVAYGDETVSAGSAVDVILEKPFSFYELRDAIAEALPSQPDLEIPQ